MESMLLELPILKKHNLAFIGFNNLNDHQKEFLETCEKQKDMYNYASELKKNLIDLRKEIQRYLVLDINEEKYIGLCITQPSLYDIKSNPKPISIYYAVSNEYRNRGYATTILKEITDYLFTNDICNKINLEIRGINKSSLRVAKNVGFEYNDEYFEMFEEEGYDYIPMSLCKKIKGVR